LAPQYHDALREVRSMRTRHQDSLRDRASPRLKTDVRQRGGTSTRKRRLAAEADRFPDPAATYLADSWTSNIDGLAETIRALVD
jgi:hypothetical protein